MIAGLATGPLAQAVGWALLHLVWQGAAIAAVLALALTLLPGRSASVRYTVSCAALALLVVLGVGTAIRSYPHRATAAPAFTPLRVVPLRTPVVSASTVAPIRVGRFEAARRAAHDALPAVVSVWLAGVALLTVRLVLQWMRARRIAETASLATESWQAATQRLSAVLGVRQVVRVLESAAIQIPSVIGLVRPAILLPASTMSGLTPAQLEMILAHELAHIRRHDFLVNLLQVVVETLLFYHPAVWWISKQVRIERENCCDDLALSACGTPLLYARALTRLEELRAEALPLAVSSNGGSLLERIRRIVGGSAQASGPAVRGAAAIATLVCALVVVAAPSLSAMSKAPAAPAGPSDHATRAAQVAFAQSTRVALEVSTSTATRTMTHTVSSFGEPAAGGVVAQAQDENSALDPAPDPNPAPDPDPMAADESQAGDDRVTVDDLIQLRAQNVTPERMRELRALFPRIRPRQMASMNAVGATPQFVRGLRAAGIPVEAPEEAQSLAAVGVTPEFVDGMRAGGIAVESASDAQGLAALGVTPQFVRELRAVGLPVETAQEAVGLAAVGVTADFVRSIESAGLALESASEIQSLAAVGVTPAWVRDMRRAGVALVKASDAQSLRALGVTPEFVRRLDDAGYRHLTVEQLSRLGAAGVTGDFIREMSQYRSQ